MDQVSLTPTSPEELLDSCWQRLLDHGPGTDDADLSTLISREQLAEFMTEAALLAIDASGLAEPATSARPVAALLQSLKVMGDQAGEEGRPGWTIICQRAVRFIERVAKDVTRFLEYPDLRVRHATTEMDLRVEVVTLQEDGRVLCAMVTSADDRFTASLDSLVAAGPLDDFVRIAVSGVSRVVVEDAIAQLFATGAVKGLPPVIEPVAHLRLIGPALDLCAADDEGAFPVFGKLATDTPGEDTVVAHGGVVHHLGAHAEYIMDGKSAHAQPSGEMPLDGQ